MAKLAMLMRQLSDDIIPILYVREPAGRYLASIQQNFRTHSTAPAPGPIELRRVVENIRQHFGDQLVVRPFEPAQLFNCDIVTDFTQHFLEAYIPTGLVNPTRENESMSAEAMAISSAYRAITRSRQEGQIDSEAIQFLQTVLETDHQLKGYSKPKLVPEVANYVRSASIDYKWLAETYGITFAPLRSDIDSVATNQAPNIEKLSDAVHVSWTRYDGLLETIADRLGAKAPPSSVLKEMASTHQATRPCFINWEQFRLQKLPRPTRQLLQLARSITRRSEKRYH
jgi:hypothetical protein